MVVLGSWRSHHELQHHVCVLAHPGHLGEHGAVVEDASCNGGHRERDVHCCFCQSHSQLPPEGEAQGGDVHEALQRRHKKRVVGSV